jgi:hypothetical protein
VEAGRFAVGGFHDWRRGRDDAQATALTDSVNVAMSVQDDDSLAERKKLTNKAAAVD